MQVENRLTPVVTIVDHETITLLGKTEFFRDPGGPFHQDRHKGVSGGNFRHGVHMNFGDEQHVNGSRGTDVMESHDLVVLENDLGWDLFTDNLAKGAMVVHVASWR
jgi:hypothetical protein